MHCSIDDILIFDLYQVITLSSINSNNLNGKRNEIINNTLENVLDTITFSVASDGWVKDDFSINQIDSNIENWLETMVFVVWNTDLISEIAHGFYNTISDTVNDQGVNI